MAFNKLGHYFGVLQVTEDNGLPDPEFYLKKVQDALAGLPGNPARMIAEQCLEIAVLLLEKNASYGNAALAPLSVFSRGTSAVEKINVRLDDKLSRIARGHEYGEEDTDLDLLGYLVLRRVALRHPPQAPSRVESYR